MSVLPATGTLISMGRTRNAYGLSGAVYLGHTLNPHIGLGVTATTNFSHVYGGRTTPYTY